MVDLKKANQYPPALAPAALLVADLSASGERAPHGPEAKEALPVSRRLLRSSGNKQLIETSLVAKQQDEFQAMLQSGYDAGKTDCLVIDRKREPVQAATLTNFDSATVIDSFDSADDFQIELRRASDGVLNSRKAAYACTARKKDQVRYRWALAMWYATEESQRLKSQRKNIELNLQAIRRAGRNFVTNRRVSSGMLLRRLSVRSQSSSNGEETVEQEDLGTQPSIQAAFVSRDQSKSIESNRFFGKGPIQPLPGGSQSPWNRAHQILILVSSLYSLYTIDVYVIYAEGLPVAYDIGVYGINAICFLVFVFDFMYFLYMDPKFRQTVYMWLELFAILSMIPDVCVFAFLAFNENHQVPTRFTNLLRLVRLWRFIGQAARTGTRVSRVFRVLGLMNTFPGTRRFCMKFRNKVDVERKLEAVNADSSFCKDPDLEESPQKDGHDLGTSSIGHDLDHTVSIHYTIMVSIMLIMSVCIANMLSGDGDAEVEMNLALIVSASMYCNKSECNTEIFQDFLNKADLYGQTILYFQIPDKFIYGDEGLVKNYRVYPYAEVIVARIASKTTNISGISESVMHVLNRKTVVLQCWSSFIMTSVVLVFLTLLTTSLAGEIRSTVIVPLQRMVATVLALESDPLRPLRRNPKNLGKKLHEVILIENALFKIAALLQLGFGEAGANIIQETMKQGNSVALKADVGGKVVLALYGFCDIRNFTDCTEVLQGDVVKLVNEVASHIHGSVVDNFGAPNKNIGDAFLLVWKPKGSHPVTHVAGSALRSYVRAIIEVCNHFEMKVFLLHFYLHHFHH